MTLNEAILHARSKAECGGECAAEHAQLAEWLEELRELRAGRTCKDANMRFNAWACSECGCMLLMFDDYDEPSLSIDGVADVPKYCPSCGRKVEA